MTSGADDVGFVVDAIDGAVFILELGNERLEDLDQVDEVEDDGEERIALDAAALAGNVGERAVREAVVLRDFLLVVRDKVSE